MSDTWHDKYIVEESDGWYFWDEVGQEICGPFKDKEEAIVELKKYCIEVLGI